MFQQTYNLYLGQRQTIDNQSEHNLVRKRTILSCSNQCTKECMLYISSDS